MKWGVRSYQPYPKGHSGGKEVREVEKKRKARVTKLRNGTKRIAKTTATIAGSLLLTAAFNDILNKPVYQKKVNAGSSFANSYMKKAGTKKISKVKEKNVG